jgi:hypothetical protein
MGKYGRARQVTDDNIVRPMRFACWIAKSTDTLSEYVILLPFHENNGSVTFDCLFAPYKIY